MNIVKWNFRIHSPSSSDLVWCAVGADLRNEDRLYAWSNQLEAIISLFYEITASLSFSAALAVSRSGRQTDALAIVIWNMELRSC